MAAEPKSIDTLVEDIYKMFTSEEAVNIKEEDLEAFGDAVKFSVISALSRKQRKGTLRLSLIGHPERKIWNEVNGVPKQELSGPTLVKFLYGDILEQLLILLVRTSGHTVSDMQKEVVVNDVVGHQDSLVDGVLVDFKSASPHSFKKFKDGTIVEDDPFGYIAQLSAYKYASGAKEAGFLAIDKSSGEIVYCPIHEMELIDPVQRIDFLKKLIDKDTPPPYCYPPVADGKSGNEKLAIGCVYCDFKKTCWMSANDGKGLRAFDYSTGVRYLTKVVKEPDVPELTEI